MDIGLGADFLLLLSLGALANNVGEDKVKMLLTSLCDKLISGKKDSQRETASLGLKSVIGDLSVSNLASFSFTVPSIVLPKLKQGLQAKVCSKTVCNTLVASYCRRACRECHLYSWAGISGDHLRMH